MNTLADTMSRLIVINSDACQDLKPDSWDYGYCIFEELPNVSMTKKLSLKVDVILNETTISLVNPKTELQLYVICKQLYWLQQEDPFCKRIIGLLRSLKLQTNNQYCMEDELLMRNLIDNK